MLSRRKMSYIELARRIAQQSEAPDFRHGAVLVNHGSVLNTSPNKFAACCFASRFRTEPGIATVHAEVGAVLNCSIEQTEGGIVYVVRVNKSGDLKNSRPCPMCFGVMKHTKVRKCVFSTGDKEIPFDEVRI